MTQQPLAQPVDTAMKEVLRQLKQSLTSARTSDAFFQLNSTSTSIVVSSINESEPLLDFSYSSASTNATQINKNTIFRIGSVSTVFTVYALLLEAGFEHLEDRIVHSCWIMNEVQYYIQ